MTHGTCLCVLLHKVSGCFITQSIYLGVLLHKAVRYFITHTVAIPSSNLLSNVWDHDASSAHPDRKKNSELKLPITAVLGLGFEVEV